MGIDAHMMVNKVPSDLVTDEWLLKTSWDLCRSIGANKFFISDGMPTDEYNIAIAAWRKRLEGHPLYQRGAITHEINKLIRVDIGEPPKERRLAIDRSMVRYRDEDDPEPGMAYDNGETRFAADPGMCILEVSLYGRYYGVDYERGDIIAYCSIAEWLEQNIPGCEVWYGGDSYLDIFDIPRRDELKAHLYSKHGRDYFSYGGWGYDITKPQPCSLCPNRTYRGSQYGSGMAGKYGAFSCAGCGKNVETRDGGLTYVEAKE